MAVIGRVLLHEAAPAIGTTQLLFLAKNHIDAGMTTGGGIAFTGYAGTLYRDNLALLHLVALIDLDKAGM
jgi:hypothetical protein